jgi:hypothetical protein
MGLYATLNADKTSVDHVGEKVDANWAAKRAVNAYYAEHVLPLVVDPAPTLLATQTASLANEFSDLIIEATQVRRPWRIVDKTPAQLDRDADLAELQTILSQAAQFLGSGPPSSLAEAATDIQRLKRVCALLVKQLAKGEVR